MRSCQWDAPAQRRVEFDENFLCGVRRCCPGCHFKRVGHIKTHRAETTAAGETIKWTYDPDGRIASSIDPRGTGTGGTPAAYTTAYGHDAAGNPTTVTAPLGGVQSTVFAGDNRQTSTTDPAGGTTAYTYDADGNQTAAGATTFTYNAADQIPGATTYGYTYDAFGTRTVNALTSTAPVQPFGYTGALTGKIDMRARTMDPSTGRFTSRDPHTPATGDPYVSAYAYTADARTYLTSWERDAAAVDATAADNSATASTTGGAGAATSWFTAPAAGSNPAIALLGKYQDIKDYIAAGPPGAFDADFLNFQGTAKKGTAGVGSWNWTRNKRYIDDALAAGKEVRLVTDPNTPIYEKGNVYQRELKYLKDNGYGWVPVDDYWVVVRVRP